MTLPKFRKSGNNHQDFLKVRFQIGTKQSVFLFLTNLFSFQKSFYYPLALKSPYYFSYHNLIFPIRYTVCSKFKIDIM